MGSPKELPSLPPGAADRLAGGPAARFGTAGSSSSAGSGSLGGTVRLAATAGRPGIPVVGPGSPHAPVSMADAYAAASGSASPHRPAAPSVHDIGGSAGPVHARDYGAKPRARTGSEIDDYENGQSLPTGSGGYDYDARAGAGNEPEAEMEEERRRMEEMRLRGHSAEGSGDSAGSGRDPSRFGALDTVFLPVLEQVSVARAPMNVVRLNADNFVPPSVPFLLAHDVMHKMRPSQKLSMAVPHREDAQRTLANLRAALEDAETVTPGIMNAFAVEIFHTMSEAETDAHGEEEEEEEEEDHRNHPQAGWDRGAA